LMSDAIYKSVFGSLRNAIIHASTFSEKSLSMRAGLATLQVLEHYCLGERGAQIGERLRLELRSRFPITKWSKRFAEPDSLPGSICAAPATEAACCIRKISKSSYWNVRPGACDADVPRSRILNPKFAETTSWNVFWSEALGVARRAIDI